MPSYIIENKKSYSYIVESTPVYDKKTKSTTSSKKYIGKLNKNTGELILKPEFIDSSKNRYITIKGQTIDIFNPKLIFENTIFKLNNNKEQNTERIIADKSDIEIHNNDLISVNDIIDIKNYGASYFLINLANKIGLLDTLKITFMKDYDVILSLICYIILKNEPIDYYDDWKDDNYTLSDQKITSKSFNDLINKINKLKETEFYQTWINKLKENGFVALDIISTSQNNKNIDGINFENSKTNKQPPQINSCILCGEKSGLPVYQTTYDGNIADISILKNIITDFSTIIGDLNFKLVIDREFYSQNTVNYMIGKKDLKFIFGVPFTIYYTKELVNNIIQNINIVDDYITTINSKDRIIGITQYALWTNKFEKFLRIDEVNSYEKQNIIAFHIYFNNNKQLQEINNFTEEINNLKLEIIENGNSFYVKNKNKCDKYLIINFDNKDKNRIINIQTNKIAIQEHIKNFGYLILMSNGLFDKKECYFSYIKNDTAIKSFNSFNKYLTLDTFFISSSEKLIDNSFLLFLTKILYYSIFQVMIDKNLFKNFSIRKLLLRLNKIKCIQMNNKMIIKSVTEEQNDLLSAFDIHNLKNNDIISGI
jgi:transposase